MKHIVEAGTDAASLLLFDPQTLPKEFDAIDAAGDQAEILTRLHDEGRLMWINTDGDGGYLLHAFVDEPAPDELRPSMQDQQTADSFVVAGGKILFTGAEYGYHADDSQLQAHPHMGGSFPIENGKYTIDLFRMEYPDGLLEKTFRERVTTIQHYAHGLYNWLMFAAGVAVLTLLISLIYASWRVWLTGFLPAALIAIVLPIIFHQWSVFRSADKSWQAIQREFPSIVAIVSTNDGESP